VDKKLILDRLDNDIEPLTTSISTLTIGKKVPKQYYLSDSLENFYKDILILIHP
jgi:hypothetical protein